MVKKKCVRGRSNGVLGNDRKSDSRKPLYARFLLLSEY